MTRKHLIEKSITAAKKSSAQLTNLSAKNRSRILSAIAKQLIRNADKILQANMRDVVRAQKNDIEQSFIERLTLSTKTIESMFESMKKIATSPDVIGEIIETTTQPSGIKIIKKRYPLGLIAIIYESRPNVTIDAFTMAFKSGNAVILKGGKEIRNTNKTLVEIIKNTLSVHNIDPAILQDLSEISREHMHHILTDGRIDCIIPRGGKGLISYVTQHARIPVIITGASVVHTFVDKDADLDLAVKVVANAKTRRVSICNALDVLLLDHQIAHLFLSKFTETLKDTPLHIYADRKSYAYLKKRSYPHLSHAKKSDYDTEFLSLTLAVKIVDSCDAAIAHIREHSLGHSEAIITKNQKHVEKFFQQIDAACLYHNTSTQFSDGGEFGMGGEIGISTQKLHARGPFAYKELTTYKYLVTSKGSIRK